ncbi:MAG: transketolase [Clostridia bacterium]|nr:transketolase [Clostridia bacterium]
MMEKELKLELEKIACKVRMGIIEGIHAAKAGHPGGSLSCADILTYLYFKKMKVDPKNPDMENRDRFVLSKGHAAPALYAVLAQKGFFDEKELLNLRQIGSILQGHPDLKKIPGVDMSTGSLGQGVSAAVGMALSAKHFGNDFKVYSVLGDGELEEGQVWEAAMFAGNHKLDNLVLFIDNNNLQIDGTVEEVNSPYPIDKKFEAFGFDVICINGNDFDEIETALNKADTCDKPVAIIAKTVKGKGVSYMENAVNWHGAAPNDELYEQAMAELKKAYAEME